MQAMKCILAATIAAVFFHAPTVLGQQTVSAIHPVETGSQETNSSAEAHGDSELCQKLREHDQRKIRRIGQSFLEKEER
jgi:hypothetical protein